MFSVAVFLVALSSFYIGTLHGAYKDLPCQWKSLTGANYGMTSIIPTTLSPLVKYLPISNRKSIQQIYSL